MVDLGAGDGRWSKGGSFQKYVGVEVDSARFDRARLAPNASIVNADILTIRNNFDVALGNPPFVRHQDVASRWLRAAGRIIRRESGASPSGLVNLYAYFLWVALLRTSPSGLVVMLTPVDWVYRTSYRSLRAYIEKNRWSVDVYRLHPSVSFSPQVDPTLSLVVVDKLRRTSRIRVHHLGPNLEVSADDSGGEKFVPIPFARKRGLVYGKRGLSTGSQKVFALTESERREAGIGANQVVPCVTSLRGLPHQVSELNARTFSKWFVNSGRKCWLIKTAGPAISRTVRRHLDAAPRGVRTNATCRGRTPWYRYQTPPAPFLLYSTGFSRTPGPKIVRNRIGARNLGSVHGVYGTESPAGQRRILRWLRSLDLRASTHQWSGGMRKIEVRQMNSLLTRFYQHHARSQRSTDG